MSQKLTISAATAALVALLATGLSGYCNEKVDVRESSKKDFDDAGQLVLQKIAVRVRFGQADYSKARDVTYTTLSADLHFQAVCRHESLRSGSEMRDRSLQLIEAVQNELAGARLLLPNGTLSEPILLTGVGAVLDGFGPVEDCYGLTFIVPGYMQFDGHNRNPQAPEGA